MKFRKVLLSLFLCTFTLFALSVTTAAYCNGDVNDDSVVSTDDAILALKFATGIQNPDTVEQAYAADIIHDGIIHTADAVEILRVAAGQSTAPTHNYSAWYIEKEATCTENGRAFCECFLCGDVFYKEIQATGHNTPNLSCTSDDECLNCGEYIKATGHNFKDGICTECGYSVHTPEIHYSNKSIPFGISPEELTKICGNPQDTLSDQSKNGKFLIYVYCSDYENLGIFTFFNGKLTQFYSNATSSAVATGNISYSLSNEKTDDDSVDPHDSRLYTQVGKIQITQYIDALNETGAYAYGYLATLGEGYSFTDTTDYASNEKLVFHLTNGCRSLHGIKPLSYSKKAHLAAYNHSYDMAKNNYFSHTSQDGTQLTERLENVGIDAGYYGENIAGGQRDAYQLNNGWFNSSGHRANILRPEFKYIGIGIAYSPENIYKYLSTQDFYS